jgi:hypothetical protein
MILSKQKLINLATPDANISDLQKSNPKLYRSIKNIGDAEQILINLSLPPPPSKQFIERFYLVNSVSGTYSIVASNRLTGQTAAVASLVSYVVGSVDATFLVSANINVTASTTHSINFIVSYTDETNIARNLTLTFSQSNGVLITSIANTNGVGAYGSLPVSIRAKAGTTITLKTSGTFTSVTYNVEGSITQAQSGSVAVANDVLPYRYHVILPVDITNSWSYLRIDLLYCYITTKIQGTIITSSFDIKVSQNKGRETFTSLFKAGLNPMLPKLTTFVNNADFAIGSLFQDDLLRIDVLVADATISGVELVLVGNYITEEK